MTPLTGWLAGRFGRKLMFLISIAGFTVASMLCGAATSLAEIVLFRLLQGVFGAALIPLSQAVLLDINPPEKQGQAMAIWGMGAMLGPILGPALGGWLTDNFSWRWVFYINLPIGILAFIGVWIFLGRRTQRPKRPFDFLGFGVLAVFIGCFQLMLDRGPTEDWFESAEIWIEAILAGVSLCLFVVHSLTAEQPFFDRAMIARPQLLSACISASSSAPAVRHPGAAAADAGDADGLSGGDHGPGHHAARARRPSRHVLRRPADGQGRHPADPGRRPGPQRVLHLADDALRPGISWPVIVSGVVQGLGTGLIFVPLTTLAFATLDPRLRADAAASSPWCATWAPAPASRSCRRLAPATPGGALRPRAAPAAGQSGRPRGHPLRRLHSLSGLAALNGEVNRQAAMVAYIDDFHLMLMMTIFILPLLLLMKGRSRRAAAAASAPDLEAQGAH